MVVCFGPLTNGGSARLITLLHCASTRYKHETIHAGTAILRHYRLKNVFLKLTCRVRKAQGNFDNRGFFRDVEIDGEGIVTAYLLFAVISAESFKRRSTQRLHERHRSVITGSRAANCLEIRNRRSRGAGELD